MGAFYGVDETQVTEVSIKPHVLPPAPKPGVAKIEVKTEEGIPLTKRSVGWMQDLDRTKPRVPLYLPLKPRIIWLSGKPETGKSTDLRSIMLSYHQERYFEGGVYWTSGSGKKNPDLDFLDQEYFIEPTKKANDEHIEKLFAAKEAAEAKGKTLAPNAYIIEDGTGWLGHHTGSKKPDLIKMLASVFRHPKCTFVYVGHTATAAMPAIRTSSNLKIAHQSDSEDHWKQIKKDSSMCLPAKYKKTATYLEMVSRECTGSKALLVRSSRTMQETYIYESLNVPSGRFKMHKPKYPVIQNPSR